MGKQNGVMINIEKNKALDCKRNNYPQQHECREYHETHETKCPIGQARQAISESLNTIMHSILHDAFRDGEMLPFWVETLMLKAAYTNMLVAFEM